MRETKSKQYNVVIFRTLFSYVSLNQSLESIFSIILNSFWRMLPHIFYEPYNSRSACYAGLCSLLYGIRSFHYIVKFENAIISRSLIDFGLKIILAVCTFHSDCTRSKLSSKLENMSILKRSESAELQCSETTL